MGETPLHQDFVRCGHVVADAFGRLIQRPAASVGRSVAASSVGHSADRGGALVVMAMAIRVAAEFVAPMMLSLVLTLAVVPLGAARTATRMGGDASRRYGAGPRWDAQQRPEQRVDKRRLEELLPDEMADRVRGVLSAILSASAKCSCFWSRWCSSSSPRSPDSQHGSRHCVVAAEAVERSRSVRYLQSAPLDRHRAVRSHGRSAHCRAIWLLGVPLGALLAVA